MQPDDSVPGTASTPSTPDPSVLFVYNGDSTLRAAATDLLIKLANPAAYPCSLCDVTCGYFGQRPQWKEFLRTLPFPSLFYHRDEFHAAFPDLKHVQLPAVFLRAHAQAPPRPCIAAHEINAVADLEALERLVTSRLREAG